MLSVLKADPSFTNFRPQTAVEAVDRFVRCRRNGLKGYLVPECLIACAQSLPTSELSKFEAWIINPNADLSSLKLVEQKSICESNDSVFKETLQRIEDAMEVENEIPPLPAEYETVFDLEMEDEKLPDLETISLEPQRGTPPPSDR